MYTTCISFSTRTTKNIWKAYVLWGIKTIPRPQELYRTGIAPPGSQIPRSTTGLELLDLGKKKTSFL